MENTLKKRNLTIAAQSAKAIQDNESLSVKTRVDAGIAKVKFMLKLKSLKKEAI
jgi:hypothetical protein